jgi:Zn-dependent peptidase ImmA (M78 family)
MVSSVNKDIISWAIKRSGYSAESLADDMKIDPNDIRMWISGEKYPSYPMLEKLAYKYFKIPLILFFYPQPPDIDDPKHRLRRLPEYELARLSPDTLRIMRFSEGYQESLIEFLSTEMTKKQIFKDIKMTRDNPIEIAKITRKYLGIDIKQQFGFVGAESAFKTWRHAIEEAGIFTFKFSFKDRFISGFSLLHEQYPIIVVNNSNSFTRQIFTLMHELCHILSNVNGITDVDNQYLEYMDEQSRIIEINCNIFASEILVPSDVFVNDIPRIFDPDIVPHLADKYSVSREVILRKFLEYQIITEEYYSSKTAEWNNDFLRSAQKKPGGNWYLTQLSYLGEGFTRLAFENYRVGRLSLEQLAQHLNINSKNIEKFESYMVS